MIIKQFETKQGEVKALESGEITLSEDSSGNSNESLVCETEENEYFLSVSDPYFSYKIRNNVSPKVLYKLKTVNSVRKDSISPCMGSYSSHQKMFPSLAIGRKLSQGDFK